MGRPINKKWFGTAPVGPDAPPGVISVNGVKFADGTTATNAYIVKQTGAAAYIVQDTAKTHKAEIVFMVNASTLAALAPGQCFITATPFGGSPLPCEKIQQFRLSVYTVPNATTPFPVGTQPPMLNNTVANYSWSTVPAVKFGQADLNGI